MNYWSFINSKYLPGIIVLASNDSYMCLPAVYLATFTKCFLHDFWDDKKLFVFYHLEQHASNNTSHVINK